MWFRRHKNKEAEKALEEAQTSLRAIQQRTIEVNIITSKLREIRQRNHFAEALEAIIVHRGES